MQRWRAVGTRGIGPVLAVLLLLGACSSSDREGRTGEGAVSEEGEPVKPEDVTPGTQTQAPEDLPVVASTKGSAKGQPILLEINGLQQTSDTLVTLNFTVSTQTPGDFFNHPFFFAEPGKDMDDYSGVYLLDEVNRKKYLPVLDSNGVCLCTQYSSFTDLQVAYATFAAPPEDVETMTVVVPGFQPIRNVQISR